MRKISRLRMIRRDEWLVDASRCQRVLHVGCTDHPITKAKIEDGNLLHARIANVATEVVGLDIDQDGIETLSCLMPNQTFIVHSAEDLASCEALSEQKFDVILAADVIEHLSNLGLFLSQVKKLLKPNGKLLISTPQSFSIKRMLPMVLMAYEYVHPDHVAYYSVSTLECILSRHDLKIEEIYMFQWSNPTFKNKFVNKLLLPFLWLSGGRLCDEIALVVK